MEHRSIVDALRGRLLVAVGVGYLAGCATDRGPDDEVGTGSVTLGDADSGSETGTSETDTSETDTSETGEPDLCEVKCGDQFCTVYCDSFGMTVEHIDCSEYYPAGGCMDPYGASDSCYYGGGDLTCVGFGRVIAPVDLRDEDIGGDPIGRAWARIAALERASAACFVQFAADLDRLGAPADLIARARAAASDELEHARLASGRADALGALGARVESSSSELEPADGGRASLAEVVVETILGGCLGETLSALEAEHGAERTTGEARLVLARIAADEAAHAELAWAFVAWALREQPELAPRVAEALRQPIVPHPLGLDRTSAGEGLLADEDRVVLWREGLRELVEPVAAALLAA